MLAAEELGARLVTLGDAEVLATRAEELKLNIELRKIANPNEADLDTAGVMQVLNVPKQARVRAGKLDPANSTYVMEMLCRGAKFCSTENNVALVTAPVHKSVINKAGIPFIGHTEYLAAQTGAKTPIMMLAAGRLRVALATTHLRLADIPAQISQTRLEQVLIILDKELRQRFSIKVPRIAVLGLNPHAGESGVLGNEEQESIAPAIQRLRERGLSLSGPLPADTAFTPDALKRCDAVLAMYHDQGLPAIKALAFSEVVNITLGLPIIRTSVDHGTALDLAGTGRAKPDSLREAIRIGCKLALGSEP